MTVIKLVTATKMDAAWLKEQLEALTVEDLEGAVIVLPAVRQVFHSHDDRMRAVGVLEKGKLGLLEDQ